MPSEDQTNTIDGFLRAVAAKQPTPGGGAVAAVCGALAAAIGEMTLQYSVGRKATPRFDAELTTVIGELQRARAVMLRLMVEDQEAFAAFTEVKKLDPADERRRVAVDVCIAVPLEIATTASALLGLVDQVVEKSNRWLLSDLAVCVELSMATLRAALHSVRVNLPEVDASRRAALTADANVLLARGVATVQRVMPRIESHLGEHG